MSLITRCPACETLFRVVPDQLRVSQGWVRCGQCDEIFDASLHLLPDSSKDTVPAVGHEPSEPSLDATVSVGTASEPTCVCTDSDRLDDPGELPIEQELPLSARTQNQLVQVDESPSFSAGSPNLQLDISPSATEKLAPLEDGDVVDPEDHELDRSTDLGQASFLRNKDFNWFWKKPLVRTALGILSFSLLLVLSGQIVFYERDRIVASQPKLRPWVSAFCELSKCTLSPLRQIESITIDSSSFVKIGANTYRLNLALKSTGHTPLAVPAIEITLTDSLDQPIVRRVILPAELDAKSNTLAVGLEWPTSLILTVKTPSQPSQISGYRLLAFYP
jgi:predicted Zn finger-like uncharacterized protein